VPPDRTGGGELMDNRISVLFLCTGNSCRSQMAEGLCRKLHGDSIDAFSAGIETHGLNLLAVRAMAELDIDISGQRGKTVDDLAGDRFDFATTVCGDADETCPVFPAKTRVIHRGFDDPPKLAADAGPDDEAMPHYRLVRDEIRDYLSDLPKHLA
jgi:arsenate reductase